nr:reverse transcriptase domain-containing protein [Tanacetum cinerariifolium]
MPANLKIYDGFTDPDDRITRFVGAANQGEWEMPVWCRMFQQTLDRPARGWVDQMPNGCINSQADQHEKSQKGVPEVPQTITEMMKRVDDFVKSKEAYKSTELPRGEHQKRGQGTLYKGSRPTFVIQGWHPSKIDGYNTYNYRDRYQPYVLPRQPGRRYNNRRFEKPRQEKENLDRYCNYHGEKRHYTNNFYQLKRHLEAALESGKLNHLVKDVRQRGNNWGRQTRNNSKNRKRLKVTSSEESLWIKAKQYSMRELRAIPSTTQEMMKFPTPRGIATLVPQTAIIFKCRQLKEKQITPEEQPKEGMTRRDENAVEEEVMFNPAFPDQKAYVDDIVIKRKTKKEMIMDIAETFDNLRKVNMKLNPKKCSFGVKEGKFLSYMVTSEGMRANPKKTKAVGDMQSPKP